MIILVNCEFLSYWSVSDLIVCYLVFTDKVAWFGASFWSYEDTEATHGLVLAKPEEAFRKPSRFSVDFNAYLYISTETNFFYIVL